MDRSKIRALVALALVVLLTDLVAGSDAVRTELARRPVAHASDAAAPATRPAAAPARTAEALTARRHVAPIAEPDGPATLVRTRRRSPGAPTGSFTATYPAQSHAVRSSAQNGNMWALIVGINDYAGSTRDNIGSYQDAVALREYLLRLGWRADHILLLANRAATRSRIVQGLQWLASKTDPDSIAVFHYSGHERPYSTDVDGDGEARDVALWAADNRLLVDGDLGALLGDVPARRMWLNFAVCRAGGFDDAGTVKPGRIITYSSPESELSYEDPSVGHSVFGYYSIVEGMRSRYADANGDGVTTVQEAFSYARPRVVERTNARQHPVMVDRSGSSFSLVPPSRRPSDDPPAPEPEPSACTLPLDCDFRRP